MKLQTWCSSYLMPSLVCKRMTASGNRISPPKVALKNKLLAGVQNMGSSRNVKIQIVDMVYRVWERAGTLKRFKVVKLFNFWKWIWALDKVKCTKSILFLDNEWLTGVQSLGIYRTVIFCFERVPLKNKQFTGSSGTWPDFNSTQVSKPLLT